MERGSAGLSRSTRRDITWPINTGCTIPGGTTGVLGAVYASDVWRLEGAAMGCLRPCRRLRRAPARHRWQPNVFPATPIQITSADGSTLHESIHVFAQVSDYNGSLLTEWFPERVVLRHFTGAEARLSGANVRNQLYIGTAPGLQNLYVARTKTHLSRILLSLSQLPRRG